MPIKLTMPALSPTMEEGNLARWLVKEGDKVESGDVIAEIETDKATMEFEAVDEGTIGKILVNEGTQGVKVNEPIAVLLEEGEDARDIDSIDSSTPPSSPPQAGGAEKAEPSQGGERKSPGSRPAPSSTSYKKSDRVFASPLARRIAAQNNIDLTQIKGSGPHGRIVKADIEDAKPGAGAVQKAAPAAKAAALPISDGVDAKGLAEAYGMEYEERPNSNMRKIIAKRLLESKQSVPHFYLTIECRIDALLGARKQINEQAGGAYKLSVNDFLIKACANALHTYPAANTSWTEDAILQYKHADISVAVATDQGLITPIIKQAESKGLREISEEMKDLAARAREGKLKPEEFQGGTFSLSNLGMYGISEFGAIINPPQSCILAVGAGEQKPYIDGGEVKIGTFMKCTLSVDHRSVDGAIGAEYLQILKQYIENPVSMLV